MQHAEVINGFTENVLREVLFLHEECFPDTKCHHTEDLRNFLNNAENINILLKYNDKTIGCLLVQPQRDAVKDLKPHDPLIEDDVSRYYVDVMLILPEYRKDGFLMLLDKMLEEGKKKDIYKFSMHARVSNGLSKTVQKLFDITEARRIENWHYMAGETYDYLEAHYSCDSIPCFESPSGLPYLKAALAKNQKKQQTSRILTSVSNEPGLE